MATTDPTTPPTPQLPELMTQLMDLADLYANAVAANVDDDAPNMHELEQVEEAARSDLAEALESALAAQPPAVAAPEDPLDSPLPCDVTVGHVTIRKGVALRALVLRTQTLYDMSRPNVETLRIGGRFEPQLSPEAQALSDQLDRQASQPPAGQQDRGEATGDAETYLRGRYGAYKGHFAWRELEEAFSAGAAQSHSQPLVEVQEPAGYQMRRYYRDVGDTGWGIWHSINKDEYEFCLGRKDEDVETRLVYAAAPVRGLPLTEEQIEAFAKEVPWLGFRKDANDEYTIPVISGSVRKLIRKIEAAHGIGPKGGNGEGAG